MTRAVGNRMLATFAVGLASLVAALAAVDAVTDRAVGGPMHPFVIGFFGASFGALVLLPWVTARPGALRTADPLPLHAARAALRLLALVSFFAAFPQGQQNGVTASALTSLILVALGDPTIWGERLTQPLVLAALASFVAALPVIRPNGNAASLGVGFAPVGAVLTAFIQLTLKPVSGGDRTNTLVAWNPTWTGGATVCGSALLATRRSPGWARNR